MKRFLSMMLAVLMIVSVLPISALVASAGVTDISDFSDVGLTIISNDESTLAPGVTMNEIVVYDKNGDRVEMYLTVSDTSVDTVKFYANYKDNQNSEWGMQTLSEQVAAMESNYAEPFKVVAGLNASYYNVTTGAPTGAFVMEGVDMSTGGDNYAFFAVLKDGTVMIGAKGEYSSYKGQIKEAIGGYIHIVKDGAVAAGLDKTTKYPRQTIGITADGRVITMTADGSQAPQTIGLTVQEQAEVMLALGCVEALHLDGGNSATFGAIREGSDKFETVNTPSGQAERAVSNTLMIVSTAISDGTFDHAIISSDYDYYVPGSIADFSAFGADAANGPADEIPEAVTWALSDASFGTIADGRFVSNGKLGDVDVQMVLEGEVVGSKTISIVNPESITFGAIEKTVPYGKTAPLTITAMYNNNEVFCSADDFNWTVENAAAGSLNGFDFSATSDESIKSTNITASYKNGASIAAATITVKFGKGSEVLFDFEDGDVSEWRGTDTIGEWVEQENAKYTDPKYTILKPEEYGNDIGTQSSSVFLATEENGGQVKTGEYALGLTLERLNADGVGSWLYNYLFYTGETQVWRDVANGKSAVRVGMWVYFPENAKNTAFRICRTFTKDSSGKLYTNYDYMMSDYDGKKVSYNTDYAIPEAGWVYVYFDLTAYAYQSSTQYNPNENYAMNNGKGTDGDYYPAFIQFINGDKNDTMDSITLYIDDITLDYSDVIDDRDAPTITNPQVSANIDNFVALNGQTVSNNFLSFSANIAEITNTTNYTGLDYSTAKIYVDGIDMSKTTSFIATGNVIALSDVYLVNGTHSVTFEIADKQGNYTKLTKTLTVASTAANPVVSVVGHNDLGATPKAGSVYFIDIKATDAANVQNVVTTLKLNAANKFEYEHIITADGVTVEYEYDAINCTLTLNITSNGTVSGDAVLASVPVRVWAWDEEATGIAAATQFASKAIPVIDIECETTYGAVTYFDTAYDSYIKGFYSALDVATEIDNATAWHVHTATAVADKAATCTQDGYTGRTYCDGCKSVIDWGTIIKATGHTFEIVDGKLVCADCGEAAVINGMAQVGENYYYFINGVATTGWQMVDGNWHYFDPATLAAVSGKVKIGVITYDFEINGKLVSGVWVQTLLGMRYYYGPSFYSKGWQTIDGKEYFFEDGYRLSGGWQLVLESQQYRNWYYFNEDGTCDKTLKPADGLYTDRNGLACAQNGIGLSGLRNVDGKYYYFNHHGYAQTNGTYSGYLFKDTYEAYTGFHTKDGVLYYYVNGKTATNGLYEIDGDYYYVYWGGVVKTDGRYYIGTTFCDLPAGNYTFGADGKMLN
ncbi:MAG: phosphodiester glycosidase family protein, partial [Clostridia bacterium]|nr:phosphodiester glycosidase family protein [Clostridia bacterium]